MYTVYRDDQTSLAPLGERQIAVIGFGNQGSAQSLNMRDSGLNVIIGNRDDEYRPRAAAAGFEVVEIAEAAQRGDVVLLLIPDEVQREVYLEQIAPYLAPGNCLDLAHGYNLHYGFIEPAPEVDVVMVAPRMIGRGVRELFVQGRGASAYCAVHQDATGKAHDTMLAIAKAIGATRAGAIVTTVALETEIDHFLEQATWPGIFRVLVGSFEVLVEAGFPPEIVALELWGCKEASEILAAMADDGLYKQMLLHSQTSQYGTMTRAPMVIEPELKERFRQRLREIQTGVFAREWEMERLLGYPVFSKLRAECFAHPLNAAEEKMRELGV